MTLPGQEAGKNVEPPSSDVAATENGDVYDEDSGDYLGTIEPIVSPTTNKITLELAVFHAGEWYIYKLDRKYEHEQEPEQKGV